MTDRWTDARISARLQSAWRTELARAQADYQAMPVRIGARMQLAIPAAAIGLVLTALALVIVLRQVGALPSPAPTGVQLGPDGLPLTISDETVLRGDQISQRLADPAATGTFLAGGRLVIDGTGCPIGPRAAECTETWQLVAVEGDGPAFSLGSLKDAAGFVRTSGALTVLRVQPVEQQGCTNAPCVQTLAASAVAWRAPTKGRIPDNASGVDGAMYDALWPDYVATYGRDGETLAGYIAKADLLGSHDGPLPVMGEDLETLVGYQVPGRGFVPLSDYRASELPTAPPVDASAREVLTSYLQAVERQDCVAALNLTATPRTVPWAIIPTTNALCSSAARVTAFGVNTDPAEQTATSVVFAVSLTTGGGAFGLPDGANAWSFTLSQEESGAWRVSDGGPVSPSATPTMPVGGISRSAAEEAALRAVDRPELTAVSAVAGRAGDLVPAGVPFHDLPSEDTLIWFITLSDGGPPLGAQGAFVVVDYFNGTVYGSQDWIS